MSMQYDVSFGHLGTGRRSAPGASFRIALLGDFSGRGSGGDAETGAALAARKPLRVDVDNLDAVLARLAPRLQVSLGDAGAIEVPISAIEDFHPDQLVEQLPVFEHLLGLRGRLQSRAGFAAAAKEVLSWAGAVPLPRPASRRSHGGAVAADRRLSDFTRLVGRPAVAEAAVDDLVRRLVGAGIVSKADPRAEELIARVDAALSNAMRLILHNPEFQAAEALWRGVEMLVRRLETGGRLQVVLYDITAEELAADLAASEDLSATALYSMLVEQPALDAQAGPLGMIAGLHGFELSPPHADLLGRLAQIAAAAGAPFVSGISPDPLGIPQHDWHPLTASAWAALRALPASAYLGLAAPRFLLRLPYGKRTEPVDAFAFEEFTRQGGLSGMLWGHPALLAALLLGEAWSKAGAKMAPAGGVIGDLPVYVYRDPDGDQVALPCTERLMTERQATTVAGTGVNPVVSMRGRPEVRMGGLASVAGQPLAGRWGQVDIAPRPAAVAPPAAALPIAAPPIVTLPAVASAAVSAAMPATAVALAAMPQETEEDAAARALEEEQAEADLDALMAGLSDAPDEASVPTVQAAVSPAPDAPASNAPASTAPLPVAPAAALETAPYALAGAEQAVSDDEADLDALLADLGAEPPQAAEDESESDLDALLASLK